MSKTRSQKAELPPWSPCSSEGHPPTPLKATVTAAAVEVADVEAAVEAAAVTAVAAAAAPVSVPPAAAAAAVTAAVVVRRAARGTARTPVWLAASQRRAGGDADEPRARFRREASAEPAARDLRGAARKRGRRRRGRGGRARISTSGARASLGLPRRAARSRRHGPQHRPTPSCTAPDAIHTMPRRPATAAWRRRAAGARVRRRR